MDQSRPHTRRDTRTENTTHINSKQPLTPTEQPDRLQGDGHGGKAAHEGAVKAEAESKTNGACPIASMCTQPEEGFPEFIFVSEGEGGGESLAFAADLGAGDVKIAEEVGACKVMEFSNRHNPANAYYFNTKTYAHCQYLYRHDGVVPSNILARKHDGGLFSISFHLPSLKDFACAAVGVGIAIATDGTSVAVSAAAGAGGGLACAAAG